MINLKTITSKYTSLSNPVKASIWYTVCNIMQKGVSMLTVPIFTRLLTTEQYGVYSVYQSWYSVIAVLATLNLYYGVFNNGMVKYDDDRDRFTSTMQGLSTTITVLLFVVYLVASNFWNDVLGLSQILILVMFIELIFDPAYSFWAARQRYEFKYRNLVIVTILITIGSPIVGVGAVLLSEYKAEARVISFVAVQVIIGLYFYIKNNIKGKAFFDKKYWKFALAFNIPLIPHYLSQSILHQSDRIMISSMVGKGEAAIYGVAYSIATLMVLITSAINNSFTPYTYQCLKSKSYAELKKFANAVLVLVGAGTALVIAFGPEIIQIFAPAEYHDAIWIIPPVSASVYFMFLYPLFGNIEFYFEKNKFIMVASVLAASMNLLLNFFFINIFGYVAAGYTTLICYMLSSGGHYVFMRKIIKQNNLPKDIYDYKFFALFSVAVLGMMFVMTLVYNFIYIRYAIIIVLIVTLFINRKKIKNVLASIKKK